MAGSRIETFTYSNCVVRVHFPDLADDERKKRQKQLVKATEKLMKAMIKKEGASNE